MAGGTTFDDDFAVVTQDNYIRSRVTDNFFDEHGVFGWIESRVGLSRIKGGDNVLIPLNTAKNTGGGSYSGFDTFDNTPVETLANAVYNWKSYQKPVVATHEQISRNRSPEGKIDVWLSKVDVAMESLRDDLNQDVNSDGTGNSGKNILGLAILVDNAGTLGNIARSTNTFWQANETATGGGLVLDTSTGMIQMFNDCGLGTGARQTVDGIWTTQAIAQFYEALLLPDIRHASGGTGDGVFGNIAFRGVPVGWDRDVATGIMYFLSSSTFEAYVNPERDFVSTKIRSAMDGTLNQDAWISNILVRLEVTQAECRRNGKLTGITGAGA